MAEEHDARLETAIETLLAGLLHLQLAERRLESEIAARLGLSESDVLALALLVREPGLRVGQIAGRLDLTPGSASLLVRRLTAAGLVRRAVNASDRRSVRIEATDHGTELSLGVRDQYAAAIRAAAGAVTVDCLTTTAKVLQGTAEQLAPEEAPKTAFTLAR